MRDTNELQGTSQITSPTIEELRIRLHHFPLERSLNSNRNGFVVLVSDEICGAPDYDVNCSNKFKMSSS